MKADVSMLGRRRGGVQKKKIILNNLGMEEASRRRWHWIQG